MLFSAAMKKKLIFWLWTGLNPRITTAWLSFLHFSGLSTGKRKKVYNQWRLSHSWLTLGHFRSCSQRMWIVNSKIFRMLLCPDGQRLIYSRGLLSVVLALVRLHWFLNSVSLWGKTSIYVCGKRKTNQHVRIYFMWMFLYCYYFVCHSNKSCICSCWSFLLGLEMCWGW